MNVVLLANSICFFDVAHMKYRKCLTEQAIYRSDFSLHVCFFSSYLQVALIEKKKKKKHIKINYINPGTSIYS